MIIIIISQNSKLYDLELIRNLYSLETKPTYNENKKFLFNIIVPVFNAEKYIENVLHQLLNNHIKTIK